MNNDNHKIRVVIASNGMGIGGAERTVETIATHVNKELFDVRVLCMEAGGPRVESLRQAGIAVLVGNGTIEKIKELLPAGSVDILHFHRSGHHEPLHAAAVDYIKPKKLMETNVFAFSDDALKHRFDLQVYKSMMMLAERAWKGTSPAEDQWKYQRVVYNPVTIDRFESFRLSDEQIKEKREALGILPGEIVIGRIGRNDPVKWGDRLLSALPELMKRIPQLKVVLRTVPATRMPWLKKHHFFGGRVIVLPETSNEQEIAETYQLLDIYVHATRRGEAFGNTLNEAMVWSLPIVVENTPHWDNGQLEQTQHGQTGWVFHSVGGLVAAVADLAYDEQKRRQFGQAGRDRVVTNFGLPRGIAQYELAYRQLSGRIDDNELQAHMFPAPAELLRYYEAYESLKTLDFPHTAMPILELMHGVKIVCWRLRDSLIARGILK